MAFLFGSTKDIDITYRYIGSNITVWPLQAASWAVVPVAHVILAHHWLFQRLHWLGEMASTYQASSPTTGIVHCSAHMHLFALDGPEKQIGDGVLGNLPLYRTVSAIPGSGHAAANFGASRLHIVLMDPEDDVGVHRPACQQHRCTK